MRSIVPLFLIITCWAARAENDDQHTEINSKDLIAHFNTAVDNRNVDGTILNSLQKEHSLYSMLDQAKQLNRIKRQADNTTTKKPRRKKRKRRRKGKKRRKGKGRRKTKGKNGERKLKRFKRRLKKYRKQYRKCKPRKSKKCKRLRSRIRKLKKRIRKMTRTKPIATTTPQSRVTPSPTPREVRREETTRRPVATTARQPRTTQRVRRPATRATTRRPTTRRTTRRPTTRRATTRRPTTRRRTTRRTTTKPRRNARPEQPSGFDDDLEKDDYWQESDWQALDNW